MDAKPLCKYGSKCYRRNPDHLRRFIHPSTATAHDITSYDTVCNPPKPSHKRVRTAGEGDDSAEESMPELKQRAQATGPTAIHPQIITVTDDKETLNNVSLSSKDLESFREVQLYGDNINVKELERDICCKDIREKVKRKFLVNMPDDFYQFWEFCKYLDPDHPETSLVRVLGVELVGPYHVLAGRLDGVTWEKCVLHSRFFYDPPEMVTVVKRISNNDQYHWGFFRDDPKSSDAFIVSNDPTKGCELQLVSQHIFAAIKCEVDNTMKLCSPKQRKLLQVLDSELQMKMRELELTTVDAKTLAKQRSKETVAKCIHKIGIVVPYDKKTDVGYRSLPITDRELIKLLDNISRCTDSVERDQLFEPLQEIVTYVQFANDECDYGMGLELGLDLFCHSNHFHSVVSHLLPLAYDLLQRQEYGKIVEQHITHRQHSPLDLTQSSV